MKSKSHRISILSILESCPDSIETIDYCDIIDKAFFISRDTESS